MLVIPINSESKEEFNRLLYEEEKGNFRAWKTSFCKKLKIDDLVFFPEYRKMVRIYRIEKIRKKHETILLSLAVCEIYWRDWIYIMKDKEENPFVIIKDKRQAILNFLDPHRKVFT